MSTMTYEEREDAADTMEDQRRPREASDMGGAEIASMPRTEVEGARTPLLADEELQRYRERWDALQVRFVDEPRGSVKEADELVSDLIRRLSEVFADERASLEAQWERGTDASTEDLRMAIQRYRSFFDRLLAA